MGAVTVYVFNNCLQEITDGFVNHQSGDDPVDTLRLAGSNIPVGGIFEPWGIDFDSSNDYWVVQITLADGSQYVSNSGNWKQCNISTSADDGRCVVLMVSENMLTIAMNSSPCQTGMSAGSAADVSLRTKDSTSDGKCKCGH